MKVPPERPGGTFLSESAEGASDDPVTATLELIAKSADELAFLIEHKNGWMILQVRAPLMDHIHQPLSIDGYIMGRLPSILGRQLGPTMLHLKFVLALANDQLLGLLVGQQKVGHGDGHSGSSRSGEKTAAGNRVFHRH